MTALTADSKRDSKSDGIVALDVTASTTIYEGSLVIITAAGFAEAAAPAANTIFAGVAIDGIKTGAGQTGTIRVQTKGQFIFASSGLGQDDVGSTVYAEDDNTINTGAGTNRQRVGKITKHISATQAWVQIRPFDLT